MAELTEPDLAAALEAKDATAVAFAIRNGLVTVPLLEVEEGADQVRVFRRDDADKYMLLLFSSPASYAAMLPGEDDPRSESYDRAALREYLEANLGVLESVWFDVAGPHPMQADPADILAALSI
ncbi:dehydrogenase [Glaciihabitans arcticus]|uniref:Dehydrogenase n=1 Tax=Glaciihabitans arcticus TaxID=2668039 RepID=A0A4Q9GYR1_9MICO|nr:dehydrogenase [Glaciihabitans arcticus]TBN57943.1 dehydrogenase [Glaciihabitans arcticus]